MELNKLIKPRYEELGGRLFLNVPVFHEDRYGGPDYVVAFPVTRKGPEMWGKILYQAPGLGQITPAAERHAWKWAYAVWKNSTPEKVHT